MSTASRGGLCKATNKRGEPCGAYSLVDSEFCFTHCPERVAARKAARSAGGRARHNRTLGNTSRGDQVTLSSVGDVVELLGVTVRDLLTLENSISRARAVAYVAGIAVRCLEAGELETRISALEDVVRG